jgi:glycosyltransferase involved in cell wall biosynthesis
MRALFITPMKHLDDPVPSGDRTIARATEHLLKRAGFEVTRASQCVSFLAAPDASRMDAIEDEAKRECERLVATAAKPDLIFTYHCYYKAPDLMGPRLAAHYGVPYVIAEASHAAKRAQGPWARWHEEAERAIRSANLLLTTSEHDRAGLLRCRDQSCIADWPPFIDDTLWPEMPRWSHRGSTHFLAVAMMREGDKSESYRILASALHLLERSDWHLTLVGDGPARENILALFAPFGERVAWRGQIEGMALADAYADADCLVWPAVNEALGMVFLEAALQACPAIAGDEGGVKALVRSGETGLLVPPRDPQAFAAAMDALMAHPSRLEALSEGARTMAEQATLDAAALRLHKALVPFSLTL